MADLIEPRWVSQVEQPPRKHHEWFKSQVDDAKAKGCTWARFSIHPENDRLALFEGWDVRPDDQGDMRWSLPE